MSKTTETVAATARQLTNEQLWSLCREAAAAGDDAQRKMAKRAIEGSHRARLGCAKVVLAARAQS